MNEPELSNDSGAPPDERDSVRCGAWVAAAELEKAWREGYARGYDHGSDDATAYEWGTSRGSKRKARDENDEWDVSETKAATGEAVRQAPEGPAK